MAGASRRSQTSVNDALHSEPERFELLQAIRLLERAAAVWAGEATGRRSTRIGFDYDPRDEGLFLRSAPELGFPTTEIVGIDLSNGRHELVVTLMGLMGVSGVLPTQYAQLVLESQRHKHTALRDFLDLFNHRALSLFIRAAMKYRLPFSYERAAVRRLGSTPAERSRWVVDAGSDAIGSVLRALVGIGQPSLQYRQQVPDDTLAFYCGYLARSVRSAHGLERMLSAHFGQPLRVAQFQGRWMSWQESEQTRLEATPSAEKNFATLGRTAVLGSRTWDVQSSFRIEVGPLDYAEFREYLPGGRRFAELGALTRTFVGPAMSFTVQLTLKASEIPESVLLGDGQPGGPALGRNFWLCARQPQGDASDAVFDVED